MHIDAPVDVIIFKKLKIHSFIISVDMIFFIIFYEHVYVII